MKDKTKISRKLKIILIITAAVILAAGATFAWFIWSNGGISESFRLSNFEVKSDMYFMKDSQRIECQPSENGTVQLSLNESDDNYIGNFRADVKYKGKGYGYIRVKVVPEFDINSSVVSAPTKIPFILSSEYDETLSGNQSAWFDNRYKDLYYYYANEVSAQSNSEYSIISLITGIKNEDDDIGFDLNTLKQGGNTSVYVAVECDMVQVNRYPQLWKIDSLPWQNS